MSDAAVQVAVVTGGHSFEVQAFHRLFRALEGVDAYIQELGDFCASPGEARAAYDAVVFYNMHKGAPRDDGPWYFGRQEAVLSRLGQSAQGIVLLHHAILAFDGWPRWRELSGLDAKSFRTYEHGRRIAVEAADGGHPITAGLPSRWEIVDETYDMADCDDDCRILLRTDCPGSMKTLAWTRTFRQARVFCLQLGHDAPAFANGFFRGTLQRGIHWVAGRI